MTRVSINPSLGHVEKKGDLSESSVCGAMSMAHPVPRPPIGGGAPSSSQLPSGRGCDRGGVLVVVQEADVTHDALHDVTREERRLREYISVAKATLDAMNREATNAKAVIEPTKL